MTELGVVTVTYNAATFIKPFLDCCLRQNYNKFKLIIIDNNSKDNTLDIINNYSDERIILIRNEDNIGYAAACNQGVKYLIKENIPECLFVNNDTEFDGNLFESLISSRRHFKANAITPRITYFDDPEKNWFAGGKINFWRGFQGMHIGEGLKNNPFKVKPEWIEVATGCCVLFTLETFKKVGYFDPNYFVYFEDTDYFIRMIKLKLKLLYDPRISIKHKISKSTGGAKSDFSLKYYHRNQIYILRKNYPRAILYAQIPIIVTKIMFRFLLRMDSYRQFKLKLSSICNGMKITINEY
jgi:GT2 family glycosyltransferase